MVTVSIGTHFCSYKLFIYALYQEPMIQAVFPKFGPRSGGTQLSVRGQNLDIGSRLVVYASSQLCTVIRYQPTVFSTFIVCFPADEAETIESSFFRHNLPVASSTAVIAVC